MKKIFIILTLLFGYLPYGLGELTSIETLNKKNYFALVRHSEAPGVGDPTGFRLNDCKSQRNLSDIGRKNALALGEKIKNSLKQPGLVYSSQWCRCRDTASLLKISDPVDLKLLNSFFATPKSQPKQTAELKKWLVKELQKEKPLILVTHQVNITALTGVYPDSGEVIICRLKSNGEIEVMGRFSLRPRPAV